MKTTVTRRNALFATALAVPVLFQNAAAAEAKPKAKGKEGPLHRAIHELHDAKAYLEKAGHDFGGHKAQAIKDVDAALKSLHAAIEYEEKKGA